MSDTVSDKIMARIGYIQLTDADNGLDADRSWMKDFGCVSIVEEAPQHEKQRPLWQHMLKSLNRGDVLVVTKLSNAVRGVRELAVFIEFCRREVIRIVSIHDKLDSDDETFPAPRTQDFMNIIAGLPEEAAKLRSTSSHEAKLKKIRRLRPLTGKSKADRNKTIVKLYLAGHPIDEIWRVSGFKSRSSVFRVLADNNIEFNRGHSKKELDARKENDNENS